MRDKYLTILTIFLILVVLFLLYRYYYGGQIPFLSGSGFSLPDVGAAIDGLLEQIGHSLGR